MRKNNLLHKLSNEMSTQTVLKAEKGSVTTGEQLALDPQRSQDIRLAHLPFTPQLPHFRTTPFLPVLELVQSKPSACSMLAWLNCATILTR